MENPSKALYSGICHFKKYVETILFPCGTDLENSVHITDKKEIKMLIPSLST